MQFLCDLTSAEAGRGGDKDKGKQPVEDEFVCDRNDSSDSEDGADRGLGLAASRWTVRSDGAGPSSQGEWDVWAGMSPPPEEPDGEGVDFQPTSEDEWRFDLNAIFDTPNLWAYFGTPVRQSHGPSSPRGELDEWAGMSPPAEEPFGGLPAFVTTPDAAAETAWGRIAVAAAREANVTAVAVDRPSNRRPPSAAGGRGFGRGNGWGGRAAAAQPSTTRGRAAGRGPVRGRGGRGLDGLDGLEGGAADDGDVAIMLEVVVGGRGGPVAGRGAGRGRAGRRGSVAATMPNPGAAVAAASRRRRRSSLANLDPTGPLRAAVDSTADILMGTLQVEPADVGGRDQTCAHCAAKLWAGETSRTMICCRGGPVQLPLMVGTPNRFNEAREDQAWAQVAANAAGDVVAAAAAAAAVARTNARIEASKAAMEIHALWIDRAPTGCVLRKYARQINNALALASEVVSHAAAPPGHGG